MIPQSTVKQILDTARIEEVIGDFVTLKRQGADYVACCPFHEEKTPSFHVHPSKGFYYCFGCHKGGSAVGFLMDYDHLSYADALKYLARKYNIEVVEKEETAEEIEARQRSESLMLVTRFAQEFFAGALKTPEGHSIGYQYFKSRGLEDSTIEKYGLGWAPQSRHALADAAVKAGYKPEYLDETGLCVQSQDGSLRDSFYDRVTFPIHSVSGRVIGFGARTLKSDRTIAKYKNSKESPIYIKNQSLYGIWFAKNEIAKRDRCYLVEGYLDVLSMHQLGMTNVVASSGTALTEGQIRMIRRFTGNVTIMYDGDSAGIHAALRGINMLLRQGMNVRVVLLPDGDDPDSFARKHTLEEYREFLAANETDFITFKSDLLMSEAGSDPLRRAEVINDIADTIADIPDAVKRSVYVNDCSSRFGIDAGILSERIRKTRDKAQEDQKAAAERERARREQVDEYMPGKETTVRSHEDPSVKDMEQMEEHQVTGKAERDLLGFILTDGTDGLKFESDSEFYSGDSSEDIPTVFDFIYASMDNTPFTNTVYRKVFEAYSEAYFDGYGQDEIVRTLLDSPDRQVAFVTSQLCTSRYELTVKNFRDALMSRDSWLARFVPRAILVYQESRVNLSLNELTGRLRECETEEQTKEILKEIRDLQNAQKTIKIKLGREKENQ